MGVSIARSGGGKAHVAADHGTAVEGAGTAG